MSHLRLFAGMALTLTAALGWAAEPIDAQCHARFAKQLAALEAGFAGNRAYFDQTLDHIIAEYAASHPAASPEDYRAVFEAVFEEQFSAWFDLHRYLLAGYRKVLEGTAELKGMCEVPEAELDQQTEKTIAKNLQLYEEILQAMAPLLE